MPVVGAFARLEAEGEAAARTGLGALPGVSTFDVDQAGVVGILIESETIDEAHAVLTGAVRRVAGVMGAWPVYVGLDEAAELQTAGDLPGCPTTQGER